MENYSVYIHTCPNGKKYVGITRRSPRRRWGSDGRCYREHNAHFYSAIQKYGWDKIKHEIVMDGLTKQDAEWYERYYIEIYQTTDREHGYNHATGGVVNSAWKMPDSFFELHGKSVDKYSFDGKYLGRYRTLTEAAESVGAKGSSQISSCCNGKVRCIFSYVFRWPGDPFDKYPVARVSNDPRPVEMLDANGAVVATFPSCGEAERQTGIPNTNIIKVCRGDKSRKKAGGYFWRYKEVLT
jgi:predicted GIY-YIG superfamily endonuclease